MNEKLVLFWTHRFFSQRKILMIWIFDPILVKKRTQNLEVILSRDLATIAMITVYRPFMTLNESVSWIGKSEGVNRFENDDYVAAVVWVLQPTQPFKEQTVSSEPIINQTKTGNTRCSFSPKVNCEVFLCLNVFKLWLRDMSRDQKFKMKEIGELLTNLLCLDK